MTDHIERQGRRGTRQRFAVTSVVAYKSTPSALTRAVRREASAANRRPRRFTGLLVAGLLCGLALLVPAIPIAGSRREGRIPDDTLVALKQVRFWRAGRWQRHLPWAVASPSGVLRTPSRRRHSGHGLVHQSTLELDQRLHARQASHVLLRHCGPAKAMRCGWRPSPLPLIGVPGTSPRSSECLSSQMDRATRQSCGELTFPVRKSGASPHAGRWRPVATKSSD